MTKLGWMYEVDAKVGQESFEGYKSHSVKKKKIASFLNTKNPLDLILFRSWLRRVSRNFLNFKLGEKEYVYGGKES